MIKRTVEISRDKAHLALRHRQLLIQRDGQTVGRIPCEDIGVVVVDHPQTTYTHAALTELAAEDAALVLCGNDHLPTAMLLPMARHTQIVPRLRDQLQASLPLKKRLWQQIVQAKVAAQANLLVSDSPAYKKLVVLAGSVRSGDTTNVEAQAARIYWANWLDGERFRRDRTATDLNCFLNYGYAVLRAAVARAIVAAGLMPAVGLHHHNRSNAFCLADDLMEPFRPLVDDQVRELHAQGAEQLDQEAKAELLKVLAAEVKTGDTTGPLMVSLHRMVASLIRCYAGEQRRLEIPLACS